ncbi:MAG: hypothetical protein SFY92_07740 [Verrucomicrobiae bacterium]|nr:hypothetical protein [Verrucomicrobiae bacterium]
MKTIPYKDTQSVELSNGALSLVITQSIGPRILSLQTPTGKNFMANFDDQIGKKNGSKEWFLYGGHRLWHSPEAEPRTYVPDNDPVGIREIKGGVNVLQPVESLTQLQKEIDILLDPAGPRAELIHRLHNRGPFPIEVAAWSLSVCAPGGFAHVPFGGRARPNKYLNDRIMTVWPYTDLSDKRGRFGKDFIRVTQDSTATTPYKLGLSANAGWTSYVLGQEAFIKTVAVQSLDGTVTYPDNNVGLEIYTCDKFLELETVGPLETIQPGGCLEHREIWEVLPLTSNDPRVREIHSVP